MRRTIKERRVKMLFMALPNVLLGALTLYMFWAQEGWKAFSSSIFILLIIMWIYSAFFAFYVRWVEAGEKTDTDKIIRKISGVKTAVIKEIRRGKT